MRDGGKAIFKDFREKTKFKGKYTKFDYTKVTFDGYYVVNGSNAAVYFYDDLVIIEYKSPQPGTGASIDLMDRNSFEETVGDTTFFLSSKAPKGDSY